SVLEPLDRIDRRISWDAAGPVIENSGSDPDLEAGMIQLASDYQLAADANRPNRRRPVRPCHAHRPRPGERRGDSACVLSEQAAVDAPDPVDEADAQTGRRGIGSYWRPCLAFDLPGGQRCII